MDGKHLAVRTFLGSYLLNANTSSHEISKIAIYGSKLSDDSELNRWFGNSAGEVDLSEEYEYINIWGEGMSCHSSN